MMQKFLTKYWLAFQLVVLFVAVSMSIFKTETTGSIYLLWLSLFAVESLLLLPTVFKEESITEARKRVLRSLEGDSFTYVGLVLVGIVCIQWLNSGCSLVYLTDADVWKFSLPPVEWLPYSVNPLPTRSLLSWVVSVIAGGLIIRSGLGKGGKRFFLDTATILSGMMAVYALFQSRAGVAPYSLWAAEPSACNPGTFFAFWFLISLGCSQSSSHSKGEHAKKMLWWVFAFIGNLGGLLQFSPGLNLLVYLLVGVLLLMFRIGMLFFKGVQLFKQVRFIIGIFVAVTVVVCAIIFLMPKSPVIPRIMALQDKASFEKALESRSFRMEAAFKIWENTPWTGVGANGFEQYLGTVIEDKEWKQAKHDKQLVWNDGFQFLCEWGVIGTGVLAALIITLLIPLCVRARGLWGKRDSSSTERKSFVDVDLYVVPGVVVILLLLLEGWFSSPFQSPAVFMSWICVLAVLPGLIPTKRAKNA